VLGHHLEGRWLTSDRTACARSGSAGLFATVQNFAYPKTVQGTKAEAFDEGVLWPTQMWVK